MIDRMTEREETAEMGELVKKHRDAKQRLTCLESKATTMIEDLTAIVEVLRIPDTGRIVNPAEYGFTVASSAENLKQIQVPEKNEVVALVEELASTRRTVADFRQKLRGLGID